MNMVADSLRYFWFNLVNNEQRLKIKIKVISHQNERDGEREYKNMLKGW